MIIINLSDVMKGNKNPQGLSNLEGLKLFGLKNWGNLEGLESKLKIK